MSDQVKPKKRNWTKVQALGFWFVVVATAMFWSGVYVGSVGNESNHNAIEQAKIQAIDSMSKE